MGSEMCIRDRPYQGLWFDADDNLGYRALQPDILLTIHYTLAGVKNWKFKLKTASGEDIFTHTPIFIELQNNL